MAPTGNSQCVPCVPCKNAKLDRWTDLESVEGFDLQVQHAKAVRVRMRVGLCARTPEWRCIGVSVYRWIGGSVGSCMNARVCVRVYVCSCVDACVSTSVCACMCMHACVHAHMHVDGAWLVQGPPSWQQIGRMQACTSTIARSLACMHARTQRVCACTCTGSSSGGGWLSSFWMVRYGQWAAGALK